MKITVALEGYQCQVHGRMGRLRATGTQWWDTDLVEVTGPVTLPMDDWFAEGVRRAVARQLGVQAHRISAALLTVQE